MPIKLNLLAEAQAAEELRRKDPVKRVILAGAVVVFAMLLWSGLLYWESAAARTEQARYESEWAKLEKQYNELNQEKRQAKELTANIDALERYSTNRFLWGSALNGVQQTIPPQLTGIIQLLRLNGSHNYQITEAVAPKKKGDTTEPGKPATSTEKITISIEARDYGNPSDQNFNKFKSSILNVPYFRDLLSADGILLKSVGQPVKDLVANKEYAQFTLELQLPPKTRNE